jgi:tetratricopeptide (TPR) repeat protein
MAWFAKGRASAANDRGNEALDAGELDDAVKAFEEAIAEMPSWSVPWFNLGLVHKRRRNWEELRRCCEESARLAKDEAALWNLGIAATALGDWKIWVRQRRTRLPGSRVLRSCGSRSAS